MIEKGMTPSGLSQKGYFQALENFVYVSNQLAHQINALPGNPMDNLVSFMSRGEVYEQFEHTIKSLDETFKVIAEEYGYTEEQVEKDLTEHFELHLGDYLTECLYQEISKRENPN